MDMAAAAAEGAGECVVRERSNTELSEDGGREGAVTKVIREPNNEI